MSGKKPILIKAQEEYKVKPDEVFYSEVVRSGNGAVIKAFKKYIGKQCMVIIMAKKSKKEEEKTNDFYDELDEFKEP